MKTKCLGLFSFLALTFFISTQALSQDVPPVGSVTIAGFHYSGTGCMPNSAYTDLSEDAQAFTVLFDSYTVDTSNPSAQANPNRTIDSKGCNVAMQLAFPAGWSFAMVGLSIRGFASIDQNALGQHAIGFRAHGSHTERQFDRVSLRGPYRDDYLSQSAFAVNNLQWTPCTGQTQPINLRTSLTATGTAAAKAFITVDSLDGEVEQMYGIAWKRCTDNVNDARTGRSVRDQISRFSARRGRHGGRGDGHQGHGGGNGHSDGRRSGHSSGGRDGSH